MAATRHYERIISADSHVMEPYDLWWKPLGQKFGDRTPRLLDEYRGRQGSFFYSGNTGRPVAAAAEPSAASSTRTPVCASAMR